MSNTANAPLSSSASRHLAHQFAQCHSRPARGLKLLREHPHILSRQTRLLLEQDAAWLLFPSSARPGDDTHDHDDDDHHHRVRALDLIRAAALLEMCAGRPRHEVRGRIFALARACRTTCAEHQARADAIHQRARRRCDEAQAERTRRQEAASAAAAAAAARRHGRGIRVKFRRGNVALNYAQRDLDRARLACMSFGELCEALRGMRLEEREAVLDQMTQPGGEIRILRERFDAEAAVGQVVTGIHELYL